MHLTNIIDKFSYDQQRLNIYHNLKISTAQYQVHLDVVLLLHFHNSIINCVKFSMTTTNYCYLFDINTVAGLFIRKKVTFIISSNYITHYHCLYGTFVQGSGIPGVCIWHNEI